MKKILYVEDNEDTAEAVKIILKGEGYDVTIANCGHACLRVVKNESFDLYLLDIMLPDMSGWDIFEKLQKLGIKSKFIFLSAIPVSLERVAVLKKVGVTDYIMKPFEKADLIGKVKRALEN